MHGVGKGDILGQVKFIVSMFEVASKAERAALLLVHCIFQRFFATQARCRADIQEDENGVG
jgi:phosphohistidine swiveling domain-containing protein